MVQLSEMKPLILPVLFFCAGTSLAPAQAGIPMNPMIHPKKLPSRSIGGSTDPGVKADPPKPQKVRQITHIVLYEYRMWSNTEGKPLEAKLIAFEDLIVEAPVGATELKMPEPPATPTLKKDGKIRLLVKDKPVEVALDKLSVADREFIDQMQAALDKKAAAHK